MLLSAEQAHKFLCENSFQIGFISFGERAQYNYCSKSIKVIFLEFGFYLPFNRLNRSQMNDEICYKVLSVCLCFMCVIKIDQLIQ